MLTDTFPSRRRRRLDRIIPAWELVAWIPAVCLMTLLFSPLPRCCTSGKVEGGLFLYICVALLSKPWSFR
jgi:hypothetical protein